MFWSAPLSAESPATVSIDARTAPEACQSMAEVRQGVDALDRALVTLLETTSPVYMQYGRVRVRVSVMVQYGYEYECECTVYLR